MLCQSFAISVGAATSLRVQISIACCNCCRSLVSCGVIFGSVTSIIAHQFKKRRSTALGIIMLFATSICGAEFSVVSDLTMLHNDNHLRNFFRTAIFVLDCLLVELIAMLALAMYWCEILPRSLRVREKCRRGLEGQVIRSVTPSLQDVVKYDLTFA